uniref:Uncharacterized protein n=1 Tax=Photinus pyralis TaxID=7054 RepID=A0A1Y1L720_PHOPY
MWLTIRFQLKPVRSLENFKHTSPLSSPDHWAFPSRSGAPITVPTTKLFLPNQKSQDTQNLLQSPDDIFSSPPVPPRASSVENEFFGTASFVVGGGRSENGDPVFLVANRHTVDVVKLSPPTISPRRKVAVATSNNRHHNHRIVITEG